MSKDEALHNEQQPQVVDGFVAEDVRTLSPEDRFRLLETMFATAQHNRQPDPEREAAKAEVRELWRLIKERFHASI